MPSRRPYDDVAYLIALVLGIPALAGSVYVLLWLVNVVWRGAGVGVALLAFLAGLATLTAATYKSHELLRNSTGR